MKYTSIGRKIKQYRQERDMTQKELAEKIDVTWEMVSRYERGASSPMDRIEPISKALSVDPLQLLQEHYKSSTPEGNRVLNNIPLFTSTPKHFTQEDTKYRYNSPLWVTNMDTQAFAVDVKAANSKTVRISENGIVYVSPSRKPKDGDLVLLIENNEMVLDVNKGEYSDIVGVIIGQEEKFV